MKEFLEKSLRQQVTIMEDKELYKKFPLVYRGRYDIFKVETKWCSMDGYLSERQCWPYHVTER